MQVNLADIIRGDQPVDDSGDDPADHRLGRLQARAAVRIVRHRRERGFQIAVMIIPYLVAMLVVIKVFMASGIFEDIKYGLTIAMQSIGLGDYAETLDLMPLALTKPLTGSGARAVLVDLFDQHGPDSFLGLTASIFMGSTETTFLLYPPTGTITDTLDHWRCRFIIREDPGDLWDEDMHQLLARISRRHTWMHIEKLQELDGELGFTRDQGEN